MKKKATTIKAPTMQDVARLSGVSHTTVSFVINNVPTETISEETRARVLQAVKTLDYHPSEAARSLHRRASSQIGFTLPDPQNPHFQEIAYGIQMYAEEHGFGVLQVLTYGDFEREARSFAWLKQKRYDGLIIIPTTGARLKDEFDAVFETGYPLVTLGVFESAADNVRVELEKGERQVLEHLYELGHRRIGYIYGVADHTTFDYRLDACLRIQRELGLPVVNEWLRRCAPTVEAGYTATQELMRDCPVDERPTALIIVNDLLASAAITALHALGLRIPHDISIASFDNTQVAAHTVFPALTSVDNQAYEMGRCAAELIIARLAKHDRPRAQFELRARLMVRESTGPAAPSSLPIRSS